MSEDSKKSYEHDENSFINIINSDLEDGKSIEILISNCEEYLEKDPKSVIVRNKLSFLNDLKDSEQYNSDSEASSERIELEEEFRKIKTMTDETEIIEHYKKLEKKFPGHKGVKDGLDFFLKNQGEIGDKLILRFREISLMKGKWGEPDYEGQKKALLELEEQYPEHEGVKEALISLEKAKENNFGAGI